MYAKFISQKLPSNIWQCHESPPAQIAPYSFSLCTFQARTPVLGLMREYLWLTSTFLVSVCSTAVVGLLYPCLDSHLGEPHKFKREWASVMRCIAVFVGINHASVVSFRERLAVVVKNVVNVLLNLIQQDVQVWLNHRQIFNRIIYWQWYAVHVLP